MTNKQVICREDERSSVDVVIEFTGTVDEEEEKHREQEIEASYQARLARRRENDDREERRLRREAREIGD